MKFMADDGVYILVFPDGTKLIHDAPGRDARGGLPGELEAYNSQGNLVNAARVDIFNSRQRQEFAQECAKIDTSLPVDSWLPRLVTLARDIRLDLRKGPPPLPLDGQPAPFPLQVLPDPLQTLVRDAAAALPCPPDFLAVPLLSTLGAVIGTARVVEIKVGWWESARLWTAVVDEPGSKKSPALETVVRPLYDLQQELKEKYDQEKAHYEETMENYEVSLAVWKAMKDRKAADRPHKPPETPPVFEQLITTDATVEALAQVLEQNACGLLFVRDELTAWARAMDQYKNGRGADRQHWLSFWNGAPVIVNRKSRREPMVLMNPFVSVAGCLPPDVLGELADERGREDGFVHRLLFACPPPHDPAWTEQYIDPVVTENYAKIIRALRALEEDKRPLRMNAPARKKWTAWITEHYQEMAAPDLAPGLRGPWGKLEGTCARLALILQLAQHVCDSQNPTTQPSAASATQLEECSIARAITLIERYFKSHLRQVYARLRTTPEDLRLLAARQAILRQGGEMTLRQIYTKHIAGCTTQAAATKLAQMIVDHGLGTIGERTPPGGGRPSRVLVMHT